jgi:hypothetical protein
VQLLKGNDGVVWRQDVIVEAGQMAKVHAILGR